MAKVHRVALNELRKHAAQLLHEQQQRQAQPPAAHGPPSGSPTSLAQGGTGAPGARPKEQQPQGQELAQELVEASPDTPPLAAPVGQEAGAVTLSPERQRAFLSQVFDPLAGYVVKATAASLRLYRASPRGVSGAGVKHMVEVIRLRSQVLSAVMDLQGVEQLPEQLRVEVGARLAALGRQHYWEGQASPALTRAVVPEGGVVAAKGRSGEPEGQTPQLPALLRARRRLSGTMTYAGLRAWERLLLPLPDAVVLRVLEERPELLGQGAVPVRPVGREGVPVRPVGREGVPVRPQTDVGPDGVSESSKGRVIPGQEVLQEAQVAAPPEGGMAWLPAVAVQAAGQEGRDVAAGSPLELRQQQERQQELPEGEAAVGLMASLEGHGGVREGQEGAAGAGAGRQDHTEAGPVVLDPFQKAINGRLMGMLQVGLWRGWAALSRTARGQGKEVTQPSGGGHVVAGVLLLVHVICQC